MSKKALRLAYSRLRNTLTPQQLQDHSLAIANRCLELPIWEGLWYHIFLSIPEKNEVDTSFLLSVLQGLDKNIAVPKTAPGKRLRHYLLTDNTLLRPNHWGIPEPQEGIEVTPQQIDVVFIPLLAFDRNGFRVGYGGGYYDRFLGECRKDVLKVGLSFFGPAAEIDDLQKWDIPLDFCVTPEAGYSF